MSEISLVVRFGEVEAIEAAMLAAHTGVQERVSELRAGVEQELGRWAVGTASRDAQLGFDRELAAWVTDLSAALAKVTTALGQVREAAHQAEVRNVAILD